MSRTLINPDLDLDALAAEYKERGRVRIPDVLDPEFAEAVYQCMMHDVPWRLMYYNHRGQGPETVGRLYPGQRRAMAEAELDALIGRVYLEAETKFQYLYEAYDVLDARRKGIDKGLFLQQFLSFMGSDELFGFVRSVTRDEEFNRVDCHACRYMPGHFLKEHIDESPWEDRRFAYVFYFTRDWHPDFGGLTYFLDDGGRVVETSIPDYNSLLLFRVPVGHCVSQVSSFAPGQRNSITGWFTRYN